MSKEEAISADESITIVDEKDQNDSESSQLKEVEENAAEQEIENETSSASVDTNEQLDEDISGIYVQEDTIKDEVPSGDVDQVPTEKTSKETSVTEKTSKGSFGIIFMFFLIVVVGGAGSAGAYYFWQQQQKQVSALNKQVGSMRRQADVLELQAGKIQKQSNEIDSQSSLISRQQQSISSLQSQLEQARKTFKNGVQLSSENAAQIKGLDDKIKQAENISQKAIDVVNRNQRDWALAEINYLLRMAHQRVAVAKDIDSAIAALKGADERIEQLGDLSLFKVRKQLASDIGALSAAHKADINGMALVLDQAIVSIKSLPFITAKEEIKGLLVEQDISPINTDEISDGEALVVEEQTIIERIVETVKKWGKVKIHQRSVITANSAEEQSNVEQMLRMHLLAARLAALQFEQKQFVYELNQAEELLAFNYDRNDNRIQQLQKVLTDYTSLQLNPELPDLTEAWTLLQTEMKKAKAAMSVINAEQKKTEL